MGGWVGEYDVGEWRLMSDKVGLAAANTSISVITVCKCYVESKTKRFVFEGQWLVQTLVKGKDLLRVQLESKSDRTKRKEEGKGHSWRIFFFFNTNLTRTQKFKKVY